MKFLKPSRSSSSSIWAVMSFSSIIRHQPLSTLAEDRAKIALIPRINPFKKSKQVWLRNFQTFEPIDTLQLKADVFAVPTRVDILHRIVHWYRSLLRAGTACAKDRSMVRGSHRKIHPQKGTGKARAGSSRAPQRRGGGVVFPPIPGSWYYPLAPKVRILGIEYYYTYPYQ
jgi:large subunit ribosomal protein L4